MREYETIFVTKPDGAESQANQLLEKVNGIIERHKGAVLQQLNWGKRELAYRVDKYKQGVYHYYNYCGGNDLVADIERNLRLNDIAMKFITVKISDDVDVATRKKEIAEALSSKTAPVAHVETIEAKELEKDTPDNEEGKDA